MYFIRNPYPKLLRSHGLNLFSTQNFQLSFQTTGWIRLYSIMFNEYSMLSKERPNHLPWPPRHSTNWLLPHSSALSPHCLPISLTRRQCESCSSACGVMTDLHSSAHCSLFLFCTSTGKSFLQTSPS